MGFDIRKLDTKAASEKGLTFDVMWDGQEIGVKISVVGAESAVFKKHKATVYSPSRETWWCRQGR